MAVSNAAPEAPTKPRFKMKLHGVNFITEYGGRIPKDGVVIVDEDTAIRWLENNIAIQVAASTPTYREAKRAEAARKLVRDEVVDEQEVGHFNDLIARDPMPRMPARRVKGQTPKLGPKLTLEGAGLINTADPDDDDPEMVVPGEA